MWRQAHLGPKRAAETKLVEPGVSGQRVEAHGSGDVRAQEGEGAAHRARVEAGPVERSERGERLRDEDVEREAAHVRERGVEQAMERRAARIVRGEERREPHGTEGVVHGGGLEREHRERDGPDVSMHVTRVPHVQRAVGSVDAPDRVGLLHPRVRLQRRPAERADGGGLEERLDDDGHALSVGPPRATRMPEKGPRIAKSRRGAERYEDAMIQDKVVVITGASSGIGEATARVLAAGGAKVVLGARRLERIESLAAELGGAARKTDVTKREDVSALVALAQERFGKLDVFVTNAGIAKIGPLDDLAMDDWRAMFDVHVNGFLYAIAAALPVFRRQGSGHFVTTISTSGLQIVPRQAIYAGTKNAVRTIHEGLRQEAGPHLRVTGISPGYVRTELATASIAHAETRARIEEQMAKIAISPEAVARAIAFAIDQPADVDVGDIVVRPTAQS